MQVNLQARAARTASEARSEAMPSEGWQANSLRRYPTRTASEARSEAMPSEGWQANSLRRYPTRRIRWGARIVALFCLAALLPVRAWADGLVNVRIQVIEADRTKKDFDARLVSLKGALEGYSSARIVDEIEAKVQVGQSAYLQILKRSSVLEVTVRKIETDGTIRLRVAIEAFKFSATTRHKKDHATVLVGHKTQKDAALFLAITPKFLP